MSGKQMALGIGAVLLIGGLAWVVRERGRSAVTSCIAVLKTIEGAKATWSLEKKKTTNDVPAWSDLFGPERYISQKPICPQGGSYTLGSVGEQPTCTFPGHTL